LGRSGHHRLGRALCRGEGALLLFSANQRFELVKHQKFIGEWKAQTNGYIYRISLEMPDGAEPHELLRWDWHPRTTPDRPQPHLHVGAEEPDLGVMLPRLHIPTGRVSFEEVVRLLIAELGAQQNRDDWEVVLKDSEDRFRAFRTWS